LALETNQCKHLTSAVDDGELANKYPVVAEGKLTQAESVRGAEPVKSPTETLLDPVNVVREDNTTTGVAVGVGPAVVGVGVGTGVDDDEAGVGEGVGVDTVVGVGVETAVGVGVDTAVGVGVGVTGAQDERDCT